MSEIEDVAGTEVSLDDGQSISDVETPPEVSTIDSEKVYTFIDGGDENTAPSTYTLRQDRYSEREDGWFFFDEVTGEDSRSWRDDGVPSRIRADITNTSGATSTYRVEMVSLVQGRKG